MRNSKNLLHVLVAVGHLTLDHPEVLLDGIELWSVLRKRDAYYSSLLKEVLNLLSQVNCTVVHHYN